MSTDDTLTRYGYERTDDGGVRCALCGRTFLLADGSVMRGHALRCPTEPRVYPIPGVCDS